MIDHASIAVSNWDRSKPFYDAALGALGIEMLAVIPKEYTGGANVGGYGPVGAEKADFWMSDGGEPGPGRHYAFKAKTRAEVDAFHAAALAAGGRDNGKPGLRPIYSATYYGAFVFDPDGNNVEAVCRAPD